MNREQFTKDLEHLINHHSIENGSDTPDFILRDYLLATLNAYEKTIQARDRWHGHKTNQSEFDFFAPVKIKIVL